MRTAVGEGVCDTESADIVDIDGHIRVEDEIHRLCMHYIHSGGERRESVACPSLQKPPSSAGAEIRRVKPVVSKPVRVVYLCTATEKPT